MICTLLTILCLSGSPAAPATAAPPTVHGADVAAPPIVLVLHGGGWLSGGPGQMAPWVNELAALGVRARAISYPFGDVAAAIRHVRAVARAQPGPVILYGISAGGTIAAALAASGDVAGAVNVVGPTDFVHWSTPTGLWIKHELRMTRDQQIAASPLRRLDGRQTPQLVQCGVLDPLVLYDQCLRYAIAAKRGQRDTTLQPTWNAHGQWPADRARSFRWILARRWAR